MPSSSSSSSSSGGISKSWGGGGAICVIAAIAMNICAACAGSRRDSRNCSMAVSTMSSDTLASPLKNCRRAASRSVKAATMEAWSACSISGGKSAFDTAPVGNMVYARALVRGCRARGCVTLAAALSTRRLASQFRSGRACGETRVPARVADACEELHTPLGCVIGHQGELDHQARIRRPDGFYTGDKTGFTWLPQIHV